MLIKVTEQLNKKDIKILVFSRRFLFMVCRFVAFPSTFFSLFRVLRR
jgi:hypothetical protein